MVQDAASDAVTVTINDTRDDGGLQAKLRDTDIPADVRYVAEASAARLARRAGQKSAGTGWANLSQARPGPGEPHET